MEGFRQLPDYTAESSAFWRGGEHGQLLIHRCAACAGWHHPPQPVCPRCRSWGVAPTPVSGRASVVSFTVNHQPWLPGMKVPFVVAYVEPVEAQGVWMMTNIVNCAPERVHIGQKVRVLFERNEDVWIPLFAPDEPSSGAESPFKPLDGEPALGGDAD